MTDVTAKVVVSKHDTINEGTAYEAVSLAFAADYADDRNKAWAVATPSISLMMTVKPDVAALFPMGKPFTLTFSPEEG